MTGNRAVLKAIRLAVFDFDGVFTDNRVWVSEDGKESVACNRSDGLGLQRLHQLGIPMLILSMEHNPVVQMRAKKLKLECLSGIEDKASELRKYAMDRGIAMEHISYIGNDINDIGCLKLVGLPIVVADAYEEAKRCAKWVLSRPGGHGAVREFCDTIIDAHTRPID